MIYSLSRSVGFLVFFAPLAGLSLDSASGQSQLDSYVVPAAGASATSGEYTLVVSAGQNGPVGQIASAPNFSLSTGFLGTVVTVDTQAPSIANITAPSTAVANEGVQVAADVTDNDVVASATLYYRQGGGSSFSSVPMTAAGDTYSAQVPAGSVTSRGLEYYVEATDGTGNNVRVPTGFNVTRVNVAGEGVSRGSAQPFGTAETAYRLISVPLDLVSRTASAVLVDDLGEYDDTQWRFFSLRADQSYAEFQGGASLAAGMGYWLIVRSSGKTIDTGAGTSIATNQVFEVPLNAGWTFIGNPFNFNIPFSNLTLESGESADIRAYSGAWSAASGSLQPFVGYAITNETQSRDVLRIDPVLVAAKNQSEPVSPVDADWFVRFEVNAGEARDDDNYLVAHASAESGWDVMDRPEAPVIGDYLSARFEHPEWKKPLTAYAVDARPVPENGEMWELSVISKVVGSVRINATGVESIPDMYSVILVDEFSGSHQDLRVEESFEYTNLKNSRARRFRVLVGRDQFLQEAMAKMNVLPEKFELDQNYPNPFNPETVIRFGVPVDADVSLHVYDVLGRRIKTLLSGEVKGAGYHSITWNGRDESGQQVASGTYLYHLKVGKQVLTRKMLIVK
ncbi:MAG: T9SS type A sorting domain-containing protein [Rhodothermia bacterium]|nr:T9SS type A sorting domain-containing protein [Rhodothermia bacterium]